MKSQKVLCGGARKWALVIGWIQAVISAVLTVILSVALTLFSVFTHHAQMKLKKIIRIDPENGTAHKAVQAQLIGDVTLGVIGIVLMILAEIISCAAGVVLIRGVQTRNAKKFKTWLVIQFIILIFVIVGNIVSIVGNAEASWTVIFDVLYTFITLFFIWVVNVHRQELLGNSAGQVVPANNKL